MAGRGFLGRVFDPAQQENAWEPNVSTRAIESTTTQPGGTRDLFFRDLEFSGNRFTGKPAVIAVDPSCVDLRIDANPGARTVRKPVDFNHGRR